MVLKMVLGKMDEIGAVMNYALMNYMVLLRS
jgi:hypothetical protein